MSACKVSARAIADFVQQPLVGENTFVNQPASMDSLRPHCVVFANSFREDFLAALNSCASVLVLATPAYAGRLQCSHVIVPRPRLTFAKVLQRFFVPPQSPSLARTARISASARLGKDIAIGEYTIIGDDVDIGDGTCIGHHVVVGERTRIGRHCLIKSHCVLGEKGFGMEIDEDGHPFPIPHLGAVVLGDYVELGAFNTVVRGTLDDTCLGDHVKTDDHVHVAHNVRIGANTQIAAGAEISGSVCIGADAWLSPQCAIIDKVTIGERAMIGIGAVVTKPVAANTIVAGNPARSVGARFPETVQ